MENTLIMDVSGAWVQKPEASSVEQMNARANEKFTAKHLGSQADPLNTESVTDRGIESVNCH